MKRTILAFTIIIVSAMFWGGVARGAWVPEHLIGNLPGIQMFGDVTYNWENDEFFVTYHGHATDPGNAINPFNREPWADEEFSKACGAVVKPDGQVEYSVTLAEGDPENAFNLSAVDYNPESNGYLVTLRHDEPSIMDMRYLDANGATVAGPIRLSDKAGAQQIVYNWEDDRFLVKWSWTPSKGTWTNTYLMVRGQPSSDPFLTQQTVISPALSGNASYNLARNTFLFVYHKGGASGENESDVYGRILNSNGDLIREIPIDLGRTDQAGARAAYSWSTEQWLVTWSYFGGQPPSRGGTGTWFDIHAAFIGSGGDIVKKFIIKNSEHWEAPGPIAYDPETDKFYVTWREANDIWMVAVNPHTAAVEEVIPGDEIRAPIHEAPQLGAMVRGIAIRPQDEPKALVIWTDGYGLSGMRGTIVSLRDGKQTVIRGGGDGCLDAPPRVRTGTSPSPTPGPGPDDTPLPIVTPEPEPELVVEKSVRNITKGQTANRKELLLVDQYDILQFITLITSQTDRTVTGLVIEDQLPEGMTFREDSTLVDGTRVSGDAIIKDGLAIGDIGAGEERTVRWTAQVTDTGLLPLNANVLRLPVAVYTDNAGIFFSEALLGLDDPFIAERIGTDGTGANGSGTDGADGDGTQTGQDGDGLTSAGFPSTGPGGTVILALIGAALASFAYAGYTRSDRFHRKQAQELAGRRDPMNFMN